MTKYFAPKHYATAQALLWAAAILASALLGASTFLALVLLPTLAVCALTVVRPQASAASCRR